MSNVLDQTAVAVLKNSNNINNATLMTPVRFLFAMLTMLLLASASVHAAPRQVKFEIVMVPHDVGLRMSGISRTGSSDLRGDALVRDYQATYHRCEALGGNSARSCKRAVDHVMGRLSSGQEITPQQTSAKQKEDKGNTSDSSPYMHLTSAPAVVHSQRQAPM